MPHLEAPEDKMITTLYCGGLDEGVGEQDIKNAFYAYGESRSISLVAKQGQLLYLLHLFLRNQC